MKKTRIITVFVSALLAVAFVSCGQADPSAPENTTAPKNESTTEAETQEKTESKEETTEEATEAETESVTEEAEVTTDNPESDENVPEYGLGETVDFNDYIKDVKEVTPPLWKVTDPKTKNELYLMGTCHILPENFVNYPENIMEIYDNCDGVAVEYDITELLNDAAQIMEYSLKMIYDDDTSITDHISKETYEKAKECFENIGIDSFTLSMLDQYKTGYWINQLEAVQYLRLENLGTDGADYYFANMAHEDGKEVISIETLDIQADALNAYSDELADYILSDMADNIDDIESFAESYAEIYRLWAAGDDDSLLQIQIDEAEDELPEDLLDDYEEYMKKLAYDRNAGMADKAAEFLKNGDNYFFMAGAAHFGGDRGVDDLLEDMGYKVEKIN